MTAIQLSDAIALSNRHKLLSFIISQTGWLLLLFAGLYYGTVCVVDYWYWMWMSIVTLCSAFLQVGAILGFASLDKIISIVKIVADTKEDKVDGTASS